MGIYVKFTKTTHQIWSCHVTLASNSENFYFSPNSVLIFRKSYQIWGKLAQEQKKLQAKNELEDGKHPLIGLNRSFTNISSYQKSTTQICLILHQFNLYVLLFCVKKIDDD